MHTSRFGYFTPFQDGMQLSNYSFDSRVVLNERENAKVLLARSEPLVAVVFEEFATSWHIVYDRRPASVIWRKGARAGVFTAVQTNIIVFWISFVAIDEGLITINGSIYAGSKACDVKLVSGRREPGRASRSSRQPRLVLERSIEPDALQRPAF